MKNVSRFFSSLTLLLFLLASPVAFAIVDKDGDGIMDVPLAVAAGSRQACALDITGGHCWGGENTYGQIVMPILSHPVTISAGVNSCALDDTGVHCWGSNYNGESSTVPTLANPVAVSAGGGHDCALDDSGVHCWGDNYFGESSVPILSNPIAVSAGGDHTCALDDAGVQCWGYNDYGQTTVPTLVNPVAVSAGSNHTCALDDTGVHCWGAGLTINAAMDYEYGQSIVPLLSHPIAVSAGGSHTCALDDTGVHCWGNNNYGQATVPSLSHPIAVSAGSINTCALDDTGVRCWGNNYYGQSTVPLLDVDNCPTVVNPDQNDTDHDGIGDVCDTKPYGSTADRNGTAVAFAGDFDGDGYGDYVIGIPGYDVPASSSAKKRNNAGRALVISGKDGAVLRAINGVSAQDALGFAVAGGRDIDGDGYDDVVIGSPNAGAGRQGTITLLFGPDGARTKTINYMYGHQSKSQFGAAVALGDFNDDGYADIFVGAPKSNGVNNMTDAGAVVVLNGEPYSYFGYTLATFYGAVAHAHAGSSVGAGDIDNDGSDEIIIGAPDDDDVANKHTDAGSVAAYRSVDVYGPVSPDTPALMKKYGTATKAYFGKSVASGDVNKDGYADIIVGAPGFDDGKLIDAGSVSVISGSSSSVINTQFSIVAKAGLGNSVAAGDVNGDGYADIIAGAKLDDKPETKTIKDAGSVSIWSGNGYAPIGSTLYGATSKDYFGSAVSAGDINSDDKADLIIGIPGFDVPATPTTKIIRDAGAVKVLSGAGL